MTDSTKKKTNKYAFSPNGTQGELLSRFNLPLALYNNSHFKKGWELYQDNRTIIWDKLQSSKDSNRDRLGYAFSIVSLHGRQQFHYISDGYENAITALSSSVRALDIAASGRWRDMVTGVHDCLYGLSIAALQVYICNDVIYNKNHKIIDFLTAIDRINKLDDLSNISTDLKPISVEEYKLKNIKDIHTNYRNIFHHFSPTTLKRYMYEMAIALLCHLKPILRISSILFWNPYRYEKLLVLLYQLNEGLLGELSRGVIADINQEMTNTTC